MSGTNPINWASQGLSFGSSLLNFGLSQMGSAADSKRAFKYWNRQRDRIRAEAISDYERQRSDARKDTLEQYQLDVAAKKNAGLNPALGEGQGAVTMSQPNIDAQDNSAIQSQSGQVQYNSLLAAQLENIQADTLKKKGESGLIDTQVELNKQTFNQNLQRFPIELRLLGAEEDLKAMQKELGYANINKLRDECRILQEQLTQNQITTRIMSVDEQVKAVRTYLEIRKAFAELGKTIEEIKEVRSRTSLNYASASNQRAQAWLAPYQARNLASGTALNNAKVKTEGTQQRLNNMLYGEASQRMENWRLKNEYQRFENRLKSWKDRLVDIGYNADAQPWQNMFNVFTTALDDGRRGKVTGFISGISYLKTQQDNLFSVVDDWFRTSIVDGSAKDSLEKGISKVSNWNKQNKESFHKWNYDWHKGLSDWKQNFDNMNRRRHVENGRVVYY